MVLESQSGCLFETQLDGRAALIGGKDCATARENIKPASHQFVSEGCVGRNLAEDGITFKSVGLAVSLCDAGFETAASFFSAGHHSSDAMERTPPAAISPIYGISAGDAWIRG
jgi:hypothetical protein